MKRRSWKLAAAVAILALAGPAHAGNQDGSGSETVSVGWGLATNGKKGWGWQPGVVLLSGTLHTITFSKSADTVRDFIPDAGQCLVSRDLGQAEIGSAHAGIELLCEDGSRHRLIYADETTDRIFFDGIPMERVCGEELGTCFD